MFGLGVQEILVVLVIGLVVFGAARLPDIGAGLGKAIKNFKKATNEPEEIDITENKKTEDDNTNKKAHNK